MKYIKGLSFVFLVLFLTSCESALTPTESPVNVTISFVNHSEKSCYFWTGHETTPQGVLIIPQDAASAVITVIASFYNPQPGEGIVSYAKIEDFIKVNVADENRAILFSQKQKMNISYTVNTSLKATWDGHSVFVEGK